MGEGVEKTGHFRRDGNIAALRPGHRFLLLRAAACSMQEKHAWILAWRLGNRDDRIGFILVPDAVEYPPYRDALGRGQYFPGDLRRLAVKIRREWVGCVGGTRHGKWRQ